MQYFGLQEFLEREWRLCLDVLGEGVISAEEGSCVELIEKGFKSAISSSPLPQSCLWRAEIHKAGERLHLGIIGRALRMSNSYSDKTSYGWADQWVFKAGAGSSGEGFLGFHSGDVVLFRLDMKESRLQMACKRVNKFFSIGLPKEQKTWHVHVNMKDAGTKVTLSSLKSPHLTCPTCAWAAELGFGK